MSGYEREDFVETLWTGLNGTIYYCPGCNAANEDAEIPSVGCPCEHYGTGDGAIDANLDREAVSDE
jgi:hypothetical protein